MSLSEEQATYVYASGNTIMCACPGSGKTFAVAEKAKRIIRTWNRFHCGIAVLSFTNVAIDEITYAVGHDEAITYPHFFGTVDSFIDDIFTKYAGVFLHNQRKPFITFEYRDSRFVWNTNCYRNGCVKDISSFYWGSDDKLYRNNKEVSCEENNNWCLRYKRQLFNRGIVYQSDVPGLCTRMLRKYPEIARVIAQRYPVIIIDEAQDTSKEQMEIFDILLENGVESVDIVGDPDQSIYEWRNANPSSFYNKISDDSWNTVYLTQNRRSSQMICNATALFSKTLEGRKPNMAVGIYKDCQQKPQLFLLSENTKQRDVEQLFLQKCEQLELKDIAILTRSRIHSESDIDGLWKSEEIELFARATYEWQYGSRKKAFCCCEKAVFIMCIDDLENMSESIENKIAERNIEYQLWKNCILSILIQLQSANSKLEEWVAGLKSILLAEVLPTTIRKGHEIESVIKIKRSDAKYPDFKVKQLKIFFQNKEISSYVRSSIHGVKGESYDAVLLLVLSQSGNTITRRLLCSGALDCEMMRLAYVAMTRPKKYLAVATKCPDSEEELETRFPRKNWEYVYV